jgi:hypothetical protein
MKATLFETRFERTQALTVTDNPSRPFFRIVLIRSRATCCFPS